MISIITAVYNQLAMNQLFWEKLNQYTKNKFELIIIDNASTDGSADWFESVGVKVIRNEANYSYPHSQNQGIAVAKYDNLVFMNNDVIVSPNWDENILASMEYNGLEVATVCGIEQVENFLATRTLKRRWKKIKNFVGLLGRSKWVLNLMHKLMYPDWNKFSNDRLNKFKYQIKEGFVGNTVVMKRSALDKIGLWDERLQQADFDLYLRTKSREIEVGDMKTVHICLDTFIHHYIRLSMKAGYPPFIDSKNFIGMHDKWSPEYMKYFDSLNK